MSTKHTLKDPVCGMDLKPKEIQQRSEFEGNTFYFCSATCKKQFDTEPGKYTGTKAA